jgi:hypothetical protein
LKYSISPPIVINIQLPTFYPRLPKLDQNKEKRVCRSKKDIPRPPRILTPAAKEQKKLYCNVFSIVLYICIINYVKSEFDKFDGGHPRLFKFS